MIAYFDTQAFDHIYKKIGCTGADIASLRKAIYGRQLSIRLSVHTLEEILLGRRVSPQAFAAQIKLTLSLASSRTLVKPCAQLLLDDIRAYAAKGEADRPFLHGDIPNVVADGIAALIESDGEELEDEFIAVLDQAREDKQQFFALLEQIRHTAETISRPASGWPSLQHYFDAAALSALEKLAIHAGVGQTCKQRGLVGLLEIKTVRATIAAALIPSYEQLADSPILRVALWHHAVSAAAVAEMFVSETDVIRELSARFIIDEVNVKNLPEFLKLL
jgi:hypothetical protein